MKNFNFRVANLIGKINTNKSSRKIHNTFIDNFFQILRIIKCLIIKFL